MEIDEGLVERLAQLIHAQYLGRQAAAARSGTSAAEPRMSTAAPVDATARRPTTAAGKATRTGKATKAAATGKATKAAATGKPTKAAATGKPTKAAASGPNTEATKVAATGRASKAAKAGSTTPPAGLPTWSELDDGMRDASRDQARDIIAKLDRIGCSVEAGAPVTPFAFGPDELDLLAKEEHLRWVRERTASGWVPGPARDDAHKVHPSLVGWDALDETERDKDRDAVRDIPIVLAAAGLHVVRTPVSGPHRP